LLEKWAKSINELDPFGNCSMDLLDERKKERKKE
jgi:hypothetical protein